ncbi:MAG: hypothetical protein ABIK45_09120 [Pseudomonadota bacterium]
MSFEDFEMIYSYSRKQAIEDGVLLDVTDQAWETGLESRWQSPITSTMGT